MSDEGKNNQSERDDCGIGIPGGEIDVCWDDGGLSQGEDDGAIVQMDPPPRIGHGNNWVQGGVSSEPGHNQFYLARDTDGNGYKEASIQISVPLEAALATAAGYHTTMTGVWGGAAGIAGILAIPSGPVAPISGAWAGAFGIAAGIHGVLAGVTAIGAVATAPLDLDLVLSFSFEPGPAINNAENWLKDQTNEFLEDLLPDIPLPPSNPFEPFDPFDPEVPRVGLQELFAELSHALEMNEVEDAFSRLQGFI